MGILVTPIVFVLIFKCLFECYSEAENAIIALQKKKRIVVEQV
uniref:Uncharacterized protein n=1 Tax=Abalone asfa-like virus TaxID=2839893 RepID=A0A5K7Y3E8_9VIRU|nr:hypothetical protein [Abalone asfa-like virus]